MQKTALFILFHRNYSFTIGKDAKKGNEIVSMARKTGGNAFIFMIQIGKGAKKGYII